MRRWSDSSRRKLETCHRDLQTLANTVLGFHDCKVITGHRGKEEQERMVREGKSRINWPNGKHNSFPSNAIDLAPYRPNQDPWDFEYSLYFAGLVLGTAEVLYDMGRMTHRVRWGGNWSSVRDGRSFKDVSFYDGLHFEIVT